MASTPARRTLLLTMLLLLSAFSSNSTFRQAELESIGDPLEVTEGRATANQGVWAVYREAQIDVGYGIEALSVHPDGVLIAVVLPLTSQDRLDDIGIIVIYEYDQWRSSVHEISDLGYDDIQFSPTGEHLAGWSNATIRIWSTADWGLVFEDEFDQRIQDIDWSGDGMRLVAVDNVEARVYEGPDWARANSPGMSAPSSVAHHPGQDTIWMINNDGEGQVYELEDVPLVGESWIFKQNFASYEYGARLVASPDGALFGMIWGSGLPRTKLVAQSTTDFTTVFESPSWENSVSGFAWSSDSSLLAYGTADWMYCDKSKLTIRSTSDWIITHSDFIANTCNNYATGLGFPAGDAEFVLAMDAGMIQGWKPDADVDGVVDDSDDCADTPPAEGADSNGCSDSQKDTDQDGVNDDLDECVRTPAGASVDAGGCADGERVDTDQDGINDLTDECAATPDEDVADLRGCGASQRDLDLDGLNDSEDECPLLQLETCPGSAGWTSGRALFNAIDTAWRTSWDPLDRYIAVVKEDGVMSLHDPDDGSVLRFEKPHAPTADFISLQWHHRGDWLALGWEDGQRCGYILWSPMTKELGAPVSADCNFAYSIAVSPDGEQIAQPSSNGVFVFSVNDSALDYSIEDYSPVDIEFSPDGTRLVGIETNGRMILWDARDGYKLRSAWSLDYRSGLEFTPLGDRILSFGWAYIYLHSGDNSLEVTGSLMLEAEHSFIVDAVVVSHDGKRAYVGAGEWNGNYSVYTFALDDDGMYPISKVRVDSRIRDLSLSPDGTRLLVTTLFDPVEMMVADADGDGVSNMLDQCADTPFEEIADDTGCSWSQQDDDSDDVLNAEDDCPQTASGASVDAVGCSDVQVDADLDGVCNPFADSNGSSGCIGWDYCPNTPSEEDADTNGCSFSQRDDDGDGVPNIDDACNNTPSGDTVDEVGCTIDEADLDRDGVQDEWDFCFSTDENDSVDSFGCSDEQVDEDGDGVCDTSANSVGPANCTSNDRCPSTPSNSSVDANGCSWNQRDDDFDGVINEYDQCPETNETGGTYADGCSTAQRDADEDGVVDAADDCADTPAEESVDVKGCSASQQEGELGPLDTRSGLSDTSRIAGGALALLLMAGALMLFFRRPETRSEAPLPPTLVAEPLAVEPPAYHTRGALDKHGREWIEHPAGSAEWFYRDPTTQQWMKR